MIKALISFPNLSQVLKELLPGYSIQKLLPLLGIVAKTPTHLLQKANSIDLAQLTDQGLISSFSKF